MRTPNLEVVVMNQHLLNGLLLGAKERFHEAHTALLNYGPGTFQYIEAEEVRKTLFGYIDVTEESAKAALGKVFNGYAATGLTAVGVDGIGRLRGRTTTEAEFVISDNLLYMDEALRSDMMRQIIGILDRQFAPNKLTVRFYVTQRVAELLATTEFSGVSNED